MSYQEYVGRKIRHLRMEHHIHQKDLAQQIGWQPIYLSRVERGAWRLIDPEKLCLLARALHTTCDALLMRDEEEAEAPDQDGAARRTRLSAIIRHNVQQHG